MSFQYYSEQIHTSVKNGKKTTRKNTVVVKNGKGTKTVSMKERGRTRKTTKRLTPKEIHSIQNSQFIPGLFKDCQQTHQKARKMR
jgi:hypothetical protein